MFLSMFLDFWNSYSLKYLFKAASVFCKVYQNLHDVTWPIRKCFFILFKQFSCRGWNASFVIFLVVLFSIFLFQIQHWSAILQKWSEIIKDRALFWHLRHRKFGGKKKGEKFSTYKCLCTIFKLLFTPELWSVKLMETTVLRAKTFKPNFYRSNLIK